jgi:adenine specific DNA methylase Mod
MSKMSTIFFNGQNNQQNFILKTVFFPTKWQNKTVLNLLKDCLFKPFQFVGI